MFRFLRLTAEFGPVGLFPPRRSLSRSIHRKLLKAVCVCVWMRVVLWVKENPEVCDAGVSLSR